MSNPTKNQCSNNIAQLPMGDFRPRKVLYENVTNNNQFRLYLQQNAEKLMYQNLKGVETEVKCCACEAQPKEIKAYKCEASVAPVEEKPQKEGEPAPKKQSSLDAFFASLY